MVLLKPVIVVRELPPAWSKLRNDLPSIRDYACATPRLNEQELLAYLQQGVECEVCLDAGLLYDVLQAATKSKIPVGNGSIPPNVLLTDGTWVWPGALLYYIQEYHLQLDPDFVAHARQKGWQIDRTQIEIQETSTKAFYQHNQPEDSVV